jgi:hypothetical protein
VKTNEVVIARKNSDCVIGFTSGVAVAFWRFNTTAADVLELQRAAGQAYDASGKPIALVQIVPGSAVTPDSHARTALARMLTTLHGRVAHSALVHEAEGFRAAMIRSIVTGVAVLSNPGFPHRVFSTLAESITWMTQADPRFDGAKVNLAVAKVRAAVPLEAETPRHASSAR